MGRPLKINKTANVDTGFSNRYGVVGGSAGLNIVVRVKIGSNNEADGYIIKQKSKNTYLVTDGSNQGVCVLTNVNNSSLTSNTMTVTATLANSTTIRLSYLSNHWGRDFAGNKFLLSYFDSDDAPAGSLYPIVNVNNND